MPDLRRIERELRQIKNDADASTVQVAPIDTDNLLHLQGRFKGPADTCYEGKALAGCPGSCPQMILIQKNIGGIFIIDIKIPDEYPFKPPKMKFDTRIYHPNISSQTGAICLDILKDAWTPVLTLKTALISLQSLLCDAAPDDPQDAQVASHYKNDRKSFEQTARDWTQKYATGKPVDPEAGLDQAAILRLVEMGFERAVVVQALRDTNGKEDEAVEKLLV